MTSNQQYRCTDTTISICIISRAPRTPEARLKLSRFCLSMTKSCPRPNRRPITVCSGPQYSPVIDSQLTEQLNNFIHLDGSKQK